MTADIPDRSDLRRLAGAATPGPWMVRTKRTRKHGAEIATIEFDIGIVRPDDGSLIEPGDPKADAALIVAAVNALPALLNRIEALEVAINGFRWIGNNLHNSGTVAFRDVYRAALEDARKAMGDDWQPMDLLAEARAALGGSDEPT